MKKFEEIISRVAHLSLYRGENKEGKAIYDDHLLLPTIEFTGRPDIKGQHINILYSHQDGFKVGLEEVDGKDDFGFAEFYESRKHIWADMINFMTRMYQVNLDEDVIVIKGKWAGEELSKNTALEQLKKCFYIFNVEIIFSGLKQNLHSNSIYVPNPDDNIFNIVHFESHTLNIDFRKTQAMREQMKSLDKTFEQCLVGKVFEVEGPGVGLVWEGHYNNEPLTFKL